MKGLGKILKAIDQPEGHSVLLEIVAALGQEGALTQDIANELDNVVHQLFVDIDRFYRTNVASRLLRRFGEFLRIMGFTLFDEYMAQLISSPTFRGSTNPFRKYVATPWAHSTETMNMIADLLPLATFLFNEEFEWDWHPAIREIEKKFSYPGSTELQIGLVAPFIWEHIIRVHNNEAPRPYNFDRPTGQVLQFSDFYERRRRKGPVVPLFVPEEWETNEPGQLDNLTEEDEDLIWDFNVSARRRGLSAAFTEFDWTLHPPTPGLQMAMAQALLDRHFFFNGTRLTLRRLLNLYGVNGDDSVLAQIISQMNDSEITILTWLLEDRRWRSIPRA